MGYIGQAPTKVPLTSADIADGSIALADMAANSVDSDQYVDGSIDAAHLSANSVDSAAYVDGSIDAIHLSANSVDSAAYVDGSIDAIHLSANSVDSDSYVDGSIDTIHIGDDQVTGAKLNPALVSGDIIYADGTDTINRLAKPGTPAGEVLTFATSASAPSWVAASAGVSQTQGTWTPVVTGQGGGSGQSYAHQIGQYTKVGDIVQISVFMNLTAKGTITGQLEIHGLPYTNRGSGYNAFSFCQDVYWSLTVDHVLRGYVLSGDTKISFMELDHNNDNYTFLTTSHTNNNSGFILGITYQTT
jgi:hypothetical protein